MLAQNNIPPIEELIPHRGTMLLLDRVIEFNTEEAVAEYRPRREAWYADDHGNMPAWFGVELMAQTVAAHVALLKRMEGLPFKMGVLLGARHYRSSTPCFKGGGLLRMRARMILRDPGGLGAYECGIDQEGESVATATLKVYEPEDFERFVEGNLS